MNSANDRKKEPNVALLIDGENIAADLAGKMITRAAKFGQITIKRVYGDAAKLNKWDAAPGFRLIHSRSAKNGADILLSIEAVDLAHVATIDAFVIATSDQDFSHLAHHLRERNFTVVGIGEAKAPAAFRKACTEFLELPAASKPAAEKLQTLDQQVHELIGKAPNKEMRIVDLGQRMHTRFKVQIRKDTAKKGVPIYRQSRSFTVATRKGAKLASGWQIPSRTPPSTADRPAGMAFKLIR